MVELSKGGKSPALSELDLLRLTLNQVDYGLVVVEVGSCIVQFANAQGRDVLEGNPDGQGSCFDTGLCLVEARLATRRPADAEQLCHTLERTRTGVRGLLSLGTGDRTSAVAVMPLSALAGKPPPPTNASAVTAPVCYALLVFAKRQLCDSSTMALFARDCGLTNAEGQVLAKVCSGLRPSQIAYHHGVQISTVRTQLRNIRVKTSSETINEVIQKVSVLPPMARHLSGRVAGLAWQ